METPYRVLIVEDVPTDAELNERAIQEVLTPCVFKRVETEEAFLRALDEFKPDIIISDYIMPSFDGMTALKLTLERTPLIPFIIVTGSMNEDTAVNCMKEGATNYVIKQSLKRLGPAVLHALEEKKIRLEKIKAEEALKDEANRRQILMEQSRDGIVILDQNGKVYEANKAFADMLGYSTEQVRHLHVWDWDYQWTAEQLIEMIRLVDAAGDHFETRHRRKDGSIYEVDISTNGALLGGQKLVFCVCRDISERRSAERSLRKSEERLRVLMSNLPGMAYQCLNAPGWPLEFVSQGCSALTGYKPEELLGKDAILFEDIIHPEDRKEVYDKVQEHVRLGRRFHLEYRITTKQGDEKHVWEQGQLVTDPGGEGQWLEGFIMDISEHRKAEIALEQSDAELHDAYFSEAVINMILSESLNNIPLKEFLQKSLHMIFSIPWIALQPIGSISLVEDDMDALVMKTHSSIPEKLENLCGHISFGQCLCGKAAQSQEIQFADHIDEQHEICCDEISPHGHYAVPIVFSRRTLGVLNLYLNEGHIRKKKEEDFLNAIADTLAGIIMRKKAEERIEYFAYFDALTGLPNRNLFLDRLTQGIARAEYRKKLVAVMAVDIDRFKFINDTYGLDAGDAVLQEVSKRLLSSVRDGDTVARLGNDDFGVLLIDIADSSDIILIIEKIMKNVSHPIQFHGKEIMLTLSAGISVYPDDGKDPSSHIKNADRAIAIAKQQGRKNYQFYTQDMDVKAAEFVQMEKDLFNAMRNQEFILHYQPYWDINTKKIVGVEALIRWESPESGLISPGKFIPVLEDTRMIIEVGEWILRTAIRQVKEWQNKGYPVVPVSVNLSLIQFRQKDLSEMIEKIIRETGCYPSLLTLEITESAFMHDIDFTYSVLANLKKIGVSVSIDDFGTGYSSLAYLKRFPVDNLKIDMSFIREIATDPDTASIVTAIIAMAHTLNLNTIAEGVETEEQWKILRLLRCHMGQGYYFSKPLSAAEIEIFFKEHLLR
ncbi:MAG: EAL domain-containing protein [Thermodesulfovibrionales bacterium]|nr:EAL domain-containing protein [Thermodesulfovibrionales bacterium]